MRAGRLVRFVNFFGSNLYWAYNTQKMDTIPVHLIEHNALEQSPLRRVTRTRQGQFSGQEYH